MQKHGAMIGGFGHDGIALAACGSEVGCGFLVRVRFVDVELGAGWWTKLVKEAFELKSVVDVVADARDCFQPVLDFYLGGFQCW